MVYSLQFVCEGLPDCAKLLSKINFKIKIHYNISTKLPEVEVTTYLKF